MFTDTSVGLFGRRQTARMGLQGIWDRCSCRSCPYESRMCVGNDIGENRRWASWGRNDSFLSSWRKSSGASEVPQDRPKRNWKEIRCITCSGKDLRKGEIKDLEKTRECNVSLLWWGGVLFRFLVTATHLIQSTEYEDRLAWGRSNCIFFKNIFEIPETRTKTTEGSTITTLSRASVDVSNLDTMETMLEAFQKIILIVSHEVDVLNWKLYKREHTKNTRKDTNCNWKRLENPIHLVELAERFVTCRSLTQSRQTYYPADFFATSPDSMRVILSVAMFLRKRFERYVDTFVKTKRNLEDDAAFSKVQDEDDGRQKDQDHIYEVMQSVIRDRNSAVNELNLDNLLPALSEMAQILRASSRLARAWGKNFLPHAVARRVKIEKWWRSSCSWTGKFSHWVSRWLYK